MGPRSRSEAARGGSLTLLDGCNDSEHWVSIVRGVSKPADLEGIMRILLGLFVVCLGTAGVLTSASFAETALSNEISGSVREAWTARYHVPGDSDDYAKAIAVDSGGNVYVTGGAGINPTIQYSQYTTIKYDPEGSPLWLARYHDLVNAGDDAVALALDAKGNIYVTGTICTQWQIIAGCIHWAFGTIKYNPQGDLLWVARYHLPGNGDDIAAALAVDAEGNAYVTGRSFPDGKFRGSPNYATVKYDTDGRQIWVARYIGPQSSDWVYAIAVDAQGNVHVTGESSDMGATVYATVKYDPDGNELWVARYIGPRNGLNIPYSLAVDSEGNTYVTGLSTCEKRFCYATIKYDPDGTELWVARYDPPEARSGGASALAVDPEGNIYVTGRSVVGTQDYATIKYDSSGNEIWIARYHGPGNGPDWATRIALDSKGNVYVTGSSSGVGAYADYATIKYDPQGTELWVARSGSGRTDSYDFPRALALDPLGNVYVTGQSHNTADAYEYFTVKYSQ
jgi:uncharacterized delta-60 repeat protein